MFRRRSQKLTEPTIDQKLTESTIDQKLAKFKEEVKEEVKEEMAAVQERINRDFTTFGQEIDNKLANKAAMRPLGEKKISLKLPKKEQVQEGIISQPGSTSGDPSPTASSTSTLLPPPPPSATSTVALPPPPPSATSTVALPPPPPSATSTVALPPPPIASSTFGTDDDFNPRGFDDNFTTPTTSLPDSTTEDNPFESDNAEWIPGSGSLTGALVTKPFEFTGNSNTTLIPVRPKSKSTRKFRGRKYKQVTGEVDKPFYGSDGHNQASALYSSSSDYFSGGRKTKKRRRHKKKTNKKGQYKKRASRRRRNTRKK